MFGKELGERLRFATAIAVASAGLALAASSTQAQPGPSDQDQQSTGLGGVTVYAPDRYARQPTTGAMVRMDSVSLGVPLGDLDLSSQRDAWVAKLRIERAARAVCQEAEDAFPRDGDPPRSCYAMAVRQGMAQAQDIAGYPIVAWGYR